jgi:hypothetical protein
MSTFRPSIDVKKSVSKLGHELEDGFTLLWSEKASKKSSFVRIPIFCHPWESMDHTSLSESELVRLTFAVEMAGMTHCVGSR